MFKALRWLVLASSRFGRQYAREQGRQRLIKPCLVIAAFLGIASYTARAESSAVVPIDTLPTAGDVTVIEQTGAFFQWDDLAAGFTVPTHGTVTSISAALTISLFPSESPRRDKYTGDRTRHFKIPERTRRADKKRAKFHSATHTAFGREDKQRFAALLDKVRWPEIAAAARSAT